MKIGLVPAFFSAPVQAELERRGHEVCVMSRQGDPLATAFGVGQLASWKPDMVFVDFCEPPIWEVVSCVEAPVICRGHGMDIYNAFGTAKITVAGQEMWGLQKLARMVIPVEHVRRVLLDQVQQAGLPDHCPIELGGFPGVDLDQFAFVERQWGNHRVASCVGALIPKKGLDLVVSCFPDVPENVCLRFIGSIPDAAWAPKQYQQCLIWSAGIVGLGERIGFMGEMPHDELPKAMADVHFIISASWDEGTHLAVAEAAATGAIPLVRHWPDAEYFWPEWSLWSTPREFVEKMTVLATASPDVLNDLSRQARAWVEAKFDNAKLVPAFCDLIEQTGGGPDWMAKFEALTQRVWKSRSETAKEDLVRISVKPGDRYCEVGPGLSETPRVALEAGAAYIALAEQNPLICQHWQDWFDSHTEGKRIVRLESDLTPHCATETRPTAQEADVLVHETHYPGVEPDGPFNVFCFFDSLQEMTAADRDTAIGHAAGQLASGGRLIATVPVGQGTAPPKLVRLMMERCGLEAVTLQPYAADTGFLIEGRRHGRPRSRNGAHLPEPTGTRSRATKRPVRQRRGAGGKRGATVGDSASAGA